MERDPALNFRVEVFPSGGGGFRCHVLTEHQLQVGVAIGQTPLKAVQRAVSIYMMHLRDVYAPTPVKPR